MALLWIPCRWRVSRLHPLVQLLLLLRLLANGLLLPLLAMLLLCRCSRVWAAL
jgi:hypothetical protein